MIETYEILLCIVCLFLSGFYSGSEAALVSISINRAKQLIEAGGPKGKALEFLVQEPGTVLNTILIGNNLVNIFIASLTTQLANRIFDSNVVAISVGVATFLVLIFGEIIPKTFARTHAEKLAYPMIRVLQFNYYLMWPIIKVFNFVIKRILGRNAQLRGRIITRDDIEFMVNKAEKEKSIDSKQLNLLSSVLEFNDIKVKDIMVSRKEVKALQAGSGFKEIIQFIRENGHSRYPVFEEDLDSSIGFLHVKDLAFVTSRDQKQFDVRSYTKPPFFVYEHMKIQSVFDHMNRNKVHLAFVKDENGLFVGIITLEDIVEEIFGDILDEHDEEEVNTLAEETIPEEGIVVEASLTLRDLASDYDLKIPLNESFSTLAGFLLEMLGSKFPEEGQIIIWENLSFSLVEVADQEIKKVKITQLDSDFAQESSEEASEANA